MLLLLSLLALGAEPASLDGLRVDTTEGWAYADGILTGPDGEILAMTVDPGEVTDRLGVADLEAEKARVRDELDARKLKADPLTARVVTTPRGEPMIAVEYGIKPAKKYDGPPPPTGAGRLVRRCGPTVRLTLEGSGPDTPKLMEAGRQILWADANCELYNPIPYHALSAVAQEVADQPLPRPPPPPPASPWPWILGAAALVVAVAVAFWATRKGERGAVRVRIGAPPPDPAAAAKQAALGAMGAQEGVWIIPENVKKPPARPDAKAPATPPAPPPRPVEPPPPEAQPLPFRASSPLPPLVAPTEPAPPRPPLRVIGWGEPDDAGGAEVPVVTAPDFSVPPRPQGPSTLAYVPPVLGSAPVELSSPDDEDDLLRGAVYALGRVVGLDRTPDAIPELPEVPAGYAPFLQLFDGASWGGGWLRLLGCKEGRGPTIQSLNQSFQGRLGRRTALGYFGSGALVAMGPKGEIVVGWWDGRPARTVAATLTLFLRSLAQDTGLRDALCDPLLLDQNVRFFGPLQLDEVVDLTREPTDRVKLLDLWADGYIY